jgi:Flp pilus assembly protein TadD
LNACVAQSLAAAKATDVEALRRIASRIDALPKPDLGNKAVARQLNTAALEALKKEDFAAAVAQLRQAQKENPRDVEIAGNLGFALVKAGQPAEAQSVLQAALVLDPRRTSTWTPFAESLALGGKADDAKAALWVSFQWSGNREKSLAFYQDRAAKETNPLLNALYSHMAKVAAAAMATQPVASL